MTKLLRKEFALAAHPTNWIFILLSAMLLIPNYPMYVVFFYTTLGLFFTSMSARENSDLYYTLLLPVRKRDVVRARGAFFAVIELIQCAACVPFALLRAVLRVGPNAAGMDVNAALFGLSLAMLGIFNALFLPKLYKNPSSVGKPFVLASTAVVVYIAAAEVCCHAVSFFRDVLDTPDPQNIGAKLAVLAAGALVFALLSLLGTRQAERHFDRVDL